MFAEQKYTPEDPSRCSEAIDCAKDRKQSFLKGIVLVCATKNSISQCKKCCPDNVSGWSESNGRNKDTLFCRGGTFSAVLISFCHYNDYNMNLTRKNV